MASPVRSRPTFYEMLGLRPDAPGAAIAKAFARESNVLRPHAFGGIAELCLAYETLRDPARRRAYDASLGLASEWFRPPSARPTSAHFMQWPQVAAPSPEPMVESQPCKESGGEPPPEPSVVRQPEPRPAPRMERPPQPSAAPLPGQSGYEDVSVGFSPVEWKRAGKVFGGLVAMAILVGAIAGWWSGSDAAEPQPAMLPAAAEPEKAPPTFSELWEEQAPRDVEAPAVQPRRMTRDERPTRRRLAARQTEQQQRTDPDDVADPAAADPLAPETPPVPAVAAAMPLPHKTVARTIDRIGYDCGGVASATPIEGAAGAYKVICTSGQSFQAKPVNGRYRFKRLAKN